MFENEDEVVKLLLEKDDNFRRLFNKHSEFKQAINDANNGGASLDSKALGDMKKKKLLLKDQMAAIIGQHRSS